MQRGMNSRYPRAWWGTRSPTCQRQAELTHPGLASAVELGARSWVARRSG